MTFEEAKKKSCACVYKLDFPNGKSYVGMTKNLGGRMDIYERVYAEKETKVHLAIREFGLGSLCVSILSEPKNLHDWEKELVLSVLEISYIKQYDTIYPNGYNVSLGGEKLNIPVECLSSINENYTHTQGDKPILVYDIDGNFLKEFPSIARCAYDFGFDADNVQEVVGKSKAYKGKYIFREKKYNYIPEKIDVTGIKVIDRVKYNTVIVKKYVEREVMKGRPNYSIVYDENGDFVGEFSSKVEALRTFTKSHNVPFGVYHNGYVIYKKVSDDYPKKIEPYVETVGKKLGAEYKPMTECEDLIPQVKKKSYYERKGYRKHTRLINDFKVRQFDDGGFEAIYDNMRDASEKTGIRYCGIWACIMGRTKTCKGYYWEKIED